MQYISSQHYRDQDIIDAKRAAGDYVVLVSPVFSHGGEEISVVIDGHHSHAAAIADGVEPIYITATDQQCDKIALIEEDSELYLDASWVDGDWHNINTGMGVW